MMIHLDKRSKMALAEFLITGLFNLIPDSAKDKADIKKLLVKYIKKTVK